jgi:pyroglutamyl-peptidase
MRKTTVLVATLVAAGCVSPAPDDHGPRPNDDMFRDFVDGKFDGAGHPLNARVTPATALCPAMEADDDGVVALDGPCAGAIAGGEQHGALAISVHLRIDAMDDGAWPEDPVVMIELSAGDASGVASEYITRERVRATGEWTDVALSYSSRGAPLAIAIEAASGVDASIEYVEVFPARFRLVVAPGSGVVANDDTIAIELPLDEDVSRLELDGVDLRERLDELLASGVATRTDTAFRSVIEVPVGALSDARADVAQLRVGIPGDAARIELRTAAAPCAFEGDPAGTPVLLTGFQPFPADGWHDNVSEVAVRAMRPSAVPGARIMRLVLPVEYDRAAAAVRDAIARCAPEVVISFGQGGGAIALERTAYNLKDTGEVPGGVPDNRGVIAAALPIDVEAPATRTTSLPLDAIDDALRAVGEDPQPSEDPGRYICNNVFFTEAGMVGAAGPRRAGFIHLPYTTLFDDAVRARWGRALEAIVAAAISR